MDRREAIARIIARVFFEAVERNPDDERLTIDDLIEEQWESFVDQADEVLALFPGKPAPLTFL